MHDSRFTKAGWMSIVAAIVFPLAWIMEGIHDVAVEIGEIDLPVGIGPEDALFLLFAALSIYVFKSFKNLMYDQYSFRGIGTVINITILWHIIFFGGSFILEVLFSTVWPQNDLGLPLVMLIFWIVGVAVFGIIDIAIGVILLRQRSRFSSSVKVFAALSVVIGFLEGTVILSPFTLLLVPASFVVLAFVFLRRTEEVEFV